MLTEINQKYLLSEILMFLTTIFSACTKNEKQTGVIYILEWTTAKKEPFKFMQPGQTAFSSCEFSNCFVTDDVSYFDDITDFDVIMFNVYNLQRGWNATELPSKRSEYQRYVFVALEPAAYFRLPRGYNGFFNLTWTYKLKSDAVFPYLTVRDDQGKRIGPELNMQWMDVNEMKPISKKIKFKLKSKKIAAAWIVSNCGGGRNDFVQSLQTNLTDYGLKIDIFGECGKNVCPKDERVNKCHSLIETEYYFYLAFENSFCEDYVSEKVLHALQHFTVPVVFGDANYSLFMPDGSYLNAGDLGPEKLARKMYEIIRDKRKYYDFFKWHRYYSFHNPEDSGYSDEICELCAMLNNAVQMNVTSIYSSMTKWWNEPPEIPDKMIDDLILSVSNTT